MSQWAWNIKPSNVYGNTTDVEKLEDFPEPVGGVITLPAESSWILKAPIDLAGNRIVCAGTVALQGVSAETVSLTSSGLAPGSDLVFTEYTLQARNLTLNVPAGCIGFHVDGSAQVLKPACDWAYINIFGPGSAVIFDDVDNAILNTCLTFTDGWYVFTNINTLAFTESLFVTIAPGQCSICVDSAATVTRRIRTNNCAFNIAASSTGLDVPTASVAQAEGFIIDLCTFSGAGIYVTGSTYLDDDARWIECRGIQNTARIAEYTWQSNGTPTVIPGVVGTFVKILGLSIAGAYNQRFNHTNNRATYISELETLFQVTATCNLAGSNNRVFSVIAYVNGTNPVGVPQKSTTNGVGRAESITWQGIVPLKQNDYIELWIANETDTTNVTVEDLSVQILQA